jgi:hypothetical protein
MSTNSFIGIKSESGSVGVRCHWDGYPETMYPILKAIIERDGILQAVSVLLKKGERGGWSQISLRARDELEWMSAGMEAEVVEGYGVAYRDLPPRKPHILESLLSHGGHGLLYAYVVDTETGDIDAYKVTNLGTELEKLDPEDFL